MPGNTTRSSARGSKAMPFSSRDQQETFVRKKSKAEKSMCDMNLLLSKEINHETSHMYLCVSDRDEMNMGIDMTIMGE